MASLTLLFWIALLLPGYALARLVTPDAVRDGLPGAVAVSMLGAFALLSPVNILGHAFEAPLSIFSAAIIVLILAAAMLITHRKWWRDIRSLLTAALSIELFILLIDLTLTARAGTFMVGDAVIHLSRTSLLVNHGFTNGHPFFGGEYFFPTYHTNILHVLMASCAQFTPATHLDVWWAARPVGCLLAIGGMYRLAWTVFRNPAPAWAAALFVLGMHGALPFLIYPNKLAPLWIAPLILSFIIDAVRAPGDFKPILAIAAGSLVVGQLHGLYAGFALLLFAPVLCAAAVIYLIQKQPRHALRLVVCCLALAPGLAFPLVSAAHTNTPEISVESNSVEPGDAAPHAAATNPDEIVEPAAASRLGVGFSARWWRPAATLGMILLLLLVLKDQRREIALLAGCAIVAALLLWVAPIYQLLDRFLSEDWIIARMEFIFRMVFALVLGGGSVAFLQRVIKPRVNDQPWRRTPRHIATLAMIPFGAISVGGAGQFTWPYFLEQASSPRSIHHRNLQWMRDVRAFAKKNIEPGSKVLCPPLFGTLLTALHDCSIVAGGTNNLGAPRVPDRMADQRAMLSDFTNDAARDELLDEYDVDYVAFIAEPRQWAIRDAEAVHRQSVLAVHWNITIIQLPNDER